MLAFLASLPISQPVLVSMTVTLSVFLLESAKHHVLSLAPDTLPLDRAA